MPNDRDVLAAACADLVQIYPSAGGAVSALRGVSAEFPTGTATVVLGSSGAGKSTFLRVLSCLERTSAGEVWIAGEPTSRLSNRQRRRVVARHIGFVFQRPRDNVVEYLSVRDHLVVAWRMRATLGPGDIDELLTLTALDGLADRRPAALTSGEQQRLAFAMAVAARPALVVADEPTAELDVESTDLLVAMVASLAARGQTFVLASHDPAVIARADQRLVLAGGSLAAEVMGPGEPHAVVDDAGRVQLPARALGLFPDRRATVGVDPGEVRLSPAPTEESGDRHGGSPADHDDEEEEAIDGP